MSPVIRLIVLSLSLLIPFALPIVLRVCFVNFQLTSLCQLLVTLLFLFFYIKKKKIPYESYFYLKHFLLEKISLLLSFIILKVLLYL